jgi:hypothetical protein
MHVIPLDVTSEADVRAAVHYVNDHLPHSQAGIWLVQIEHAVDFL